MEFENAAQMRKVCHQLFDEEAERPVIRQGQDELCQAFIHALQTDTFGREGSTPLQALTHFLHQTFDIRNSRNAEEPLREKSLGAKLYKIAQEEREEREDPFADANAKLTQRR